MQDHPLARIVLLALPFWLGNIPDPFLQSLSFARFIGIFVVAS
jgi:hypothetical protein